MSLTCKRLVGPLAACALSAMALAGCDLNKMMADGAGGLMAKAGPDMAGLWDEELAMDGAPAGILTLESMVYLSPDNPVMNVELAKAYIGYSYAVVEVDFELQEAEGELEKADRFRHRARLLYRRARDLCLRSLRVQDAGIDEAMKGGEETLLPYLQEHYPEADDLGPVVWSAVAWGSMINMSGDMPDVVADMPLAKAMAQHVANVDPGYAEGAALAFLGGFECGFPEMFGGSLKRGSELFEKALEITERKNHTIQLNYARVCALNGRDKELYVKLLTEILEAPDQGKTNRIANKIARHRAERYLVAAGGEF